MSDGERDYPGQASDANDFSYATGRARALEAKIKEAESMSREQAIREYSLDRLDPDRQLELIMEKSLAEFANSAPESVRSFRLMADMQNLKAFLRKAKTGEDIPFSRLGTFSLGPHDSDMRQKLKDAGYSELADEMKGLLGMRLAQADRRLEEYFTNLIRDRLFLDYLRMKLNYLGSEEKPEQFYAKLGQFIREHSMFRNMHSDVATSFLLQKQRELELARSRALARERDGR